MHGGQCSASAADGDRIGRMERRHFLTAMAALAVWRPTAASQASRSGNPILPGWYADPEAHVFNGAYWIYPTYSAPYDQQTFMDAF